MRKRLKRDARRRATVGGRRRAKGKTRATLKAAPPGGIITLRTRRPTGGRGVGLGAGVCVVEGVGTSLEVVSSVREQFRTGKRATGSVDAMLAEAGRKLGRGVKWVRVSEVLAAAGHVHRLRIMAYLLEGPATYRGLQRATGLQVGPLYHHIDKLRLAGLMGPKERDLYTLTRAGRNLLLLAMVLGPLVRQRRLRPTPRP